MYYFSQYIISHNFSTVLWFDQEVFMLMVLMFKMPDLDEL